MSVYIKGMEMPTTCGNCCFCHAVGNDRWHCRLTDKSFASYSVGWGSENNMGENGQHPYIRRDDCPLIPVPDHGRLIDADAFERRCMFDPEIEDMQDVIYALRDYPTIIPADPPVMYYPQVPGITPTVISDKEGEG